MMMNTQDAKFVATHRAGAGSSVGGGEKSVCLFIDTTPSQIVTSSQASKGPTGSHVLGASQARDDDEEIIVFIPPHPRSGPLTPAIFTPT